MNIFGSVDLADNGFDGNVTATAFIEPEIIRTIPMSESDIVIQNMPEGYEGRVSAYEEEFYIQIRGLAADVNNVDVAQLVGSIDVNQLLESGIIETLEEGYYDVNLSFNLPETVALRENITVRLHVKEK